MARSDALFGGADVVELQPLVAAARRKRTMRIAATIGALGLAAISVPAWTQANPGPRTGPLGGWQSPSGDPGSGTGDIPGSGMGLPGTHAVPGTVKGAYGLDLSRRIQEARKLVDEVRRGRVLTDSDTRHIRAMMREDFIAWNKQYDLLPSAYRAERDRWLVDAPALSADDWAKQRLNWLNAQRDWILARGG
jgi:hypothetical protein